MRLFRCSPNRLVETVELPDTGMAGVSTHTRVAEIVPAATGSRVADVGAGLGSFSDWLLDHGYAVTAVDIEGARYRGRAPFVEFNIDKGLPFESESVQGVVAIELIEHLENPYAFVREAARCLTMGGWLIITTPNVSSFSSKISMIFRNYPLYFGPDDFERNGHISPMSLLDIRRIAVRAGFSLEHVTYNIGRVPIPRVRHWFPLRGRRFRNQLWGDSLIVLLRKATEPITTVRRG